MTLHGIHCSQSGSIVPHCRETTAFNRHPLHHAAWNPLHSIGIHLAMLHGIHCIQSGCILPCCMESTAFSDAAWNALPSIGMPGPCCIKSTAFNRDALGHAPWNQLHSIKLDGIHCIQSGCVLPCCMEY